MNYQIFTSESVCAGHPDKICDQISDAIVDAHLKFDPKSRVAVETLATTNKVIIAGEVTSNASPNYEKQVRKIIRRLGYTEEFYGFCDKKINVEILVHKQSGDIATGVERGGAGDQGMMFGYATDETPMLMPLPIMLAHRIAKNIDEVREDKTLNYLRPDGKCQVTVSYENGYPKEILRVVTAVPHDPKVTVRKVSQDIYENVIKPTLRNFNFKIDFKETVCNGTGKWEIGGPSQDTGVTGRKIMVDSYGSVGRVGGGCFSGKDPTKVDRSAAYAARFIAKNIVARKLAHRCEVQIAYVIGKSKPIAKAIETFGTETVPMHQIEKFAWQLLDVSPRGIIKGLNLQLPIYEKTATYGHFGKPAFSWEKVIS